MYLCYRNVSTPSVLMLSWWQGTSNFSSYSAVSNCSLKTEAGQVGWEAEQALAAHAAIGRTLCYQITRHPCSWFKNKNIVTIFHMALGMANELEIIFWHPAACGLLPVIVMKCLKKVFLSSSLIIHNNYCQQQKLYFCLFAVANQVQQDFGVLMQHHITLITISLNC